MSKEPKIDAEFAALIPRLRDDEMCGLEAQLVAEGCRDPLVVWAGRNILLDGHNRLSICKRHGLAYATTEMELASRDEARLWILQNQASRRNLSDDQRAIILDEIVEQQSVVVRARQLAVARARKAAKKAGVPVPVPEDVSNTEKAAPIDTRAEISAQHRISERKVKYARLLRRADPQAAQAVKAGDVLLADAVRAVKKREMAEQLGGIAAMKAKEVEGRFDCITCDPPWNTDKIEREVRPMDAQLPNPPMAIDEIARDVGAMIERHAQPDCHVFVWTTHRFLPDALALVAGWGLRYTCLITWHKNGGMQPFGLPQHNSEHAIYARRGKPEFIDISGFSTCFSAPRGEHSEKPTEFYQMIARATAGRRLDMFNRREIPGFVGWGKEAP